MQRGNARRLMAAALGFALVFGLACAKPKPGEFVAFSEKLRERYGITDAELRELQYYISHQIVIERVATGGTHKVDRGRLIARGDTTIHQVVVRARTPGWIEAPAFVGDGEQGHVLEVSFERGAPLRFAPWEAGGAYTLESPPRVLSLAEIWTGVARARRFEVAFAGEQWWVEAGAAAALLIETDALERLAHTRRVLEGVRGPSAR